MAARTTGDRSSTRLTDPLHQAADLEQDIARIGAMNVDALRAEWRRVFGSDPPPAFSKDLLARVIAYRLQEQTLGGLSPSAARLLRTLAKPSVESPRQVKVGSIFVREHKGIVHEVLVVPGGFCWQGTTYDSLSTIAKKITGVTWNGPRFFGLRSKKPEADDAPLAAGASGAPAADGRRRPGRRSSLRALAGASGAIQ